MPSPDFSTLALLIITGFIAGVCNAIAGGGTFFTLPIFLAAGLPPVLANASNAVAVWPGHILASVGYREVLRQDRRLLLKSAAIGLAGALVGAYALSTVGNARFRVMIPWLILLATVLFASGARLHAFFNTLQSNRALSLTHPNGCGVLIQFILAVYGGFFSAGLGVMLMAMLMAFGIHDMQRNNAYKNALASVISTVAIVIFIAQGLVNWSHALPAFASGIIGGVVGAKLAQRLSAHFLKKIVIAIGLTLSIYYAKVIYFS